jgi:hypothetical protein
LRFIWLAMLAMGGETFWMIGRGMTRSAQQSRERQV